MISPYIDIFIEYLNTNSAFFSEYFIVLVFFITLFESLPILGAVTPGTLLLLFFGFSGASLGIDVSLMILASTVGSIMGDLSGYALGKYGSGFLIKHKKLLKASHIEEGRRFFSNHGFKSIFIGRFVGIVRPVVSLIAGSISMRFSRFVFFDILASFLWSTIYIIIGFYFGQHFREIERFVSNIGTFLTIMLVLSAGIYYFKFKKNKSRINTHENSQAI
ncbi:DedA family protein [Candidatus Parcubacteria bacterium]|nr:DedA family protein [Candidatus Parcubacteria bacterium]